MKHRLAITVDKELADAAREYAKLHYTTISQLVRNYLAGLKRELERSEQGDSAKTSSVEIK
ncbi:MAG: DUF6364 family protein [Candidatus Poribacteria bacterium]